MEKEVEKKLVTAVQLMDGVAVKFVSPGFAGMPDRLVLLPGGKVIFVEVKAPGEEPRPLQQKRHSQLKGLGFEVHVLDDPREIPDILKEVTVEWVEL